MTPDRSSTLCALPWIHLSTTVDGVWGRCCFDASNDYEHLYRESEEPAFTLRDDAIGCLRHSRYARDNPDRVFGVREAFNSPEMRRTRREMLAGRRPDACQLCYAREDAGATSHRHAMNRAHGRILDDEHLLERTAPDGTLDAAPIYLDLRLGNNCNLGCIMCSFPVSSRLGAGARPAWTTARIDPYADDDELWAELSELAPSRIRRVGGPTDRSRADRLRGPADAAMQGRQPDQRWHPTLDYDAASLASGEEEEERLSVARDLLCAALGTRLDRRVLRPVIATGRPFIPDACPQAGSVAGSPHAVAAGLPLLGCVPSELCSAALQ